MRVATAFSLERDTTTALSQAFKELVESLGGEPTWVLVEATVLHDVPTLQAELRRLAPAAAVHGSTSCVGVMTHRGFHTEEGLALGLLGLRDEDGAFGVSGASLGDDAKQAGSTAIRGAIARASRAGEVPSMIWLSSSPGREEEVIAGIEAVVGHGVPIVGGSAADNTVAGNWQLFTKDERGADLVVLTALFPSTAVASTFQSGYSPGPHRGRVTRANGRTINEIDGRPAAAVYDEWAGGILGDQVSGGNVLSKTTLAPLGRQIGAVMGVPYFCLAHPDSVTPEGGLSLFARITEGDELILMQGTTEGLQERAGRVAQAALEQAGWQASRVAGALVIFCAGCMLTVREQMDAVVDSLKRALPGVPFLGSFTFGEQGCLTGGENRHGNLMISVTLLER
jgi:hypothetical protein